MDPLLCHHLPITTNQLEFFCQSIGLPPTITSRIDFVKQIKEDFESDLESDNDKCGVMMDINTTGATPLDVSSSSPGADEPAEEIADLLDTGEKKIPKPKGQPGHP